MVPTINHQPPTTNLPPACRKAWSSDSETFSLFRCTFSRFCVCLWGGLAGPQGEREWERISLRGVLHTVFVWVSHQHHTLKHARARTHTHTHIQIHTRSHSHSHTHIHTHTHTQMQMQMHIQSHIHTASHSRCFTHTHTQHIHTNTAPARGLP